MTGKGKKRGDDDIKVVLGIIGFMILYAVMSAYVIPLNPEILVQNWGIGIMGIIIFSGLYLACCFLEIKKLLLRPKRLYLFLIVVSTCWISADWADFILFMQGG